MNTANNPVSRGLLIAGVLLLLLGLLTGLGVGAMENPRMGLSQPSARHHQRPAAHRSRPDVALSEFKCISAKSAFLACLIWRLRQLAGHLARRRMGCRQDHDAASQRRAPRQQSSGSDNQRIAAQPHAGNAAGMFTHPVGAYRASARQLSQLSRRRVRAP